MSDILKTYYEFAQLSMAAYGTFVAGQQPPTDVLTSSAVGFSHLLAEEFNQQYTVLHQQSVGGFTATLFQARLQNGDLTGPKILAIRGTDGFLDVVTDLNILFGTAGLFDAQYQALKRYYEQLVAPAGQELSGNRVGLGLLGQNEQIAVTGHSLGGYLAQTFTADPMFSSKVLHAYTYNAPGYNGIWAEIAELVGFSPASTSNAQITNLFATNGLSATSGLGTLVGTVQNLFIEEGSSVHNHSIVTLTDSLALYNLFGTLDPNVEVESITEILNAAGTNGGSSLESSLFALRSLFQTPPNSLTPNTPLDAQDRDAYYQVIDNVASQLPLGSYVIESLIATPNVASQAEQSAGIAYRYALTQLNPFVIHGADYDRHNTNGELELVNLSAGTGTLTGQYLSDRAQFLAEKIALNLKDETTSVGTIYFHDVKKKRCQEQFSNCLRKIA